MKHNLKITCVYIEVTVKEVKVAVESGFFCENFGNRAPNFQMLLKVSGEKLSADA